jgi:hypothetical protein
MYFFKKLQKGRKQLHEFFENLGNKNLQIK